MIMRKLRGILGAALIWAIAWVPLGLAFGVWRWLLTPAGDFVADSSVPQRSDALPIIAVTVAMFAVWGIVVGIVFALSVISAERKGAITGLSRLRLAVWGALSAVALPIGMMFAEFIQTNEISFNVWFVVFLAISAGWGALCASAILRIARHGSHELAA